MPCGSAFRSDRGTDHRKRQLSCRSNIGHPEDCVGSLDHCGVQTNECRDLRIKAVATHETHTPASTALKVKDCTGFAATQLMPTSLDQG
eukprot:gene12662-6562_t